MDYKTCTKCGLSKPAEGPDCGFYKNSRRRDGLNSVCKQCHADINRGRYQTNPDVFVARSREFRQTHPDAFSTYQKTHRRRTMGTWQSFFRSTWNHINGRTVNGSHPNPRNPRNKHYIDKGIRIAMTKEEYRAWCHAHREEIERMYRDGLKPSLDRIDNDLHYSIDNLQVLPLREHTSKDSRNAAARRKFLTIAVSSSLHASCVSQT